MFKLPKSKYRKKYERLCIDYNITFGISRGNVYAWIETEKERDNLEYEMYLIREALNS